MKKLVLLLIITNCMMFIDMHAQGTMYVHLNTGNIASYAINDIDSITFSTIPANSDTPVILSVVLNTTVLSDGTDIEVTLVATSLSPVDQINSSLDGPNGNIYGGGHGATYTETSPGIWEYSWTNFVSEWAPSGVYTYSGISVANAAQLVSEIWAGPTTLTINNSQIATTPVIQTFVIDTNSVSGGLNLDVTITATSNAPVDWINSSLYGPNGNIYGGGHGATFTEISSGTWEYSWTDFVSEWSPSGTYKYVGVSVENLGDLVSADWSGLDSVVITNSAVAATPVIQNVLLDTTAVSGGTNITITLTASSNAPVGFINRSFYGPNGNIYGGGHGATFTEISSGTWEYVWTDFVSDFAPSGQYYYTSISVENLGAISSSVWGSLVSVSLN